MSLAAAAPIKTRTKALSNKTHAYYNFGTDCIANNDLHILDKIGFFIMRLMVVGSVCCRPNAMKNTLQEIINQVAVSN